MRNDSIKRIVMTEFQLYNFIYDNNIEWHWADNDGELDVLIFPMVMNVREFMNLIINKIKAEDDGVSIILKDGYFAVWLSEICEFYGIDIENVFNKYTEGY